MRKTVAAALLAAGITFAPVVSTVHAQTDPAAATNNDNSDSSKVGLWGLLGLLGLGGLAGLKRRDVRSGTAAAYGNGAGYTTTGQTGVTRP